MKKTGFFLLLLALGLSAIAQTQVTVTAMVIPPYSPYISTYVDQPNKLLLTLINNTGSDLNVKLWVRIAGDNGVSATTAPGFTPQQPLVLHPGVNQVDFSSDQTRTYFDANHVTLQGITKMQIIQNQAMPEGNYQICVQAMDYTTGSPLSIEGTGCTSVFPVNYIDPPVPLSPACGSDAPLAFPQNVIFTWSPPATANGNIQYEFTLKEVPSSMPNPVDVIKNNAFPVLYNTTLSSVNTLVYTNANPQLEIGKHYVWRVRVTDPGNQSQFKNQGFSAPCDFVYGGTPVPTVKTTNSGTSYQGNELPKLPASAAIALQSIKGKLQWCYRKTEETNPASEVFTTGAVFDDLGAGVTLANISAGTESNLNNLFGGGGGSGSGSGGGTFNYSSSEINAGNAGGNFNGNGYFFQGQTYNTPALNGALGQANTNTPFYITQDKINNLAGNTKYPLKSTKVKITMTVKPEVAKLGNGGFVPDWMGNGNGGGLGSNAQSQTLGTATTNSQGEFTITIPKDIIPDFYDLKLEIADDNFIFPAVQVPITKSEDGVYTIGTLTGLAKTFRLQIQHIAYVYDATKGYYVEGEKLSGVKTILKHDPDDWSFAAHPNLVHECNRDKMGIAESISNPTIADTKETNLFPRLFANRYTGGYILLESSREGFLTNKLGLNISEQNHPELFTNYLDKAEAPTYYFKCKLSGAEPEVKGTVLAKGPNSPMKGVIVRIKRGSLNYYTTTNDKGEFDIKGIESSTKPYKLTVESGSLTLYTEELTLAAQAQIMERTLYVQGVLIPVTGTVVDEDNHPLKDALATWETGGEPSYTDPQGSFLLSNVEGKHTLIIKKAGFRDLEVEVDVKKPGSTISIDNGSLTDLTLDLSNTNTQQIVNSLFGGGGNGSGSGSSGSNSGGNNFSGSLGGIGNWSGGNISNSVPGNLGAGNYQVTSELTDLTGGAGALNEVGAAVNLGKFVMKRFHLVVKVRNATKDLLPNCTIEFNGAPVGTTNAYGWVVLENVSANTSNGLVVYGPSGSDYLPKANNIVIDASMDTTYMEVYLQKGIAVSGKVSLQNGTAVKDALIYIDGSEYIKTKSDNSGNYKFAAPAGPNQFVAVKSGLVGDKQSQTLTAGTPVTINFTLKDAGFDASKLLGFDIQLTESTPLPNNEFEISGQFVNIPSNSIFKSSPGMVLPFTKQKVKKSGAGIIPSGSEIVTDVSSVDLALWSYLKLNLNNSAGLKVKPLNGDNNKGKIDGNMRLKLAASFPSISGFSFPTNDLSLKSGNLTSLTAFTSDGSNPLNETTLKLNSTTNTWTVYDFSLTVDYNNTFINKDGITIAGSISPKGFKYLSDLTMKINEMQISNTGDIKKLKLEVNPMPKVSLGAWGLNLSNLDIASTGLVIGGELKGSVAGYDLALPFKDLSVTKSGLNGGSFGFPTGGINLLDVVKIKPGQSSSLTFGMLPNGSGFKLGGNVEFSFEKYFNKNVKIDDFGLSSDGNISASIKLNQTYKLFSIVNLSINNLGINTASKQFDLGGKIAFDLPSFGAGVGTTMHYKKSGVTFDQFHINLSMGGIGGFSSDVDFADGGFSGTGDLSIASSGMKFSGGFHYNNTGFGANFNMGPTVKVPISVVTLDKIGGGFDYNKPQSKFKVWGECRVSTTGDVGGLITLDPTTFSIEVSGGGPVLSASATAKLVGMSLANASFVMDIPQRKASLNVDAAAGTSIMPGISATGSYHIGAELGFGSSPYFYFGQMMNMKVVHICNSSGGMFMGVNYLVNSTTAAQYKIPTGMFSGISAFATASIGSDEAHAAGIDVGIGWAKVWCGYSSDVSFYANANGMNAGFHLGGTWGAGAKACVRWAGCIGLDASASGNIDGKLNSGGIESVTGKLSAHAGASLGCCDGCGNGLCWALVAPCGAQVCVDRSVTVTYSKSSGFDIDF
ncbi:MAG: carboxypeptidase-like regulatory domain-containing protein [Chitinophagales bacterium]